MTNASDESADVAGPQATQPAQPKQPQPKQPPQNPGANLIPTGLAKQLAWFVVRLAVSYTLVAVAIESLSPLLDVLIARTARNLLAFVSSPYYLKTIDWVEQGFAVTTWIGPLQDGFKLPSLSFVFAFAIGYVLALPGMLRSDYWIRAAVVILISFFVCALSVAIIADSRLSTALGRLEIAMVPAWRSAIADFLAYYLWMLTVRLYPLMMVILLTYESGAFRQPKQPDVVAQRIRQLGFAVVGVLLAISLGFDSFANKRIAEVEAEPLSKRIEHLAEISPDIGRGLVNLAEHMHEGRNIRGALWTYRYALDHLEGKEKRIARRAYDKIHERYKKRLLEDAEARRESRSAERDWPE